MINTVIFDMDGLLLSTEPIYFECYKKSAIEQNLVFTKELFELCVGLSTQDAAKVINHYFHEKCNVEELYRRTYFHFEEYIKTEKDIPFCKGAKEAIIYFHQRRLNIALASSNIRKWVDYLLTKKEILPYFSTTTTATEVKNPKPDPELYLTTAKKLQVSPSQCLVFEDSIAGATAAISASMRTCVVPQIKQPNDFVRQHAFKIYNSLLDIYPDVEELLN